MKRGIVLAFLSALAVAFSACSTPAAPTPAVGPPPVEISAISPAMGTVLSRGTTVDLSLTVVSHVASPGRVTLSLQNQDRVALLASAPAVDIAARGEGRLGRLVCRSRRGVLD
jgi:hypothetical protein